MTQWRFDRRSLAQDSRAHPRIPTCLKGRLLSIDGRCYLACTIIDLSEGGARVNTAHYALLPSELFLLVEKTGDNFECEMRWLRSVDLGLSFIDTPGRTSRKTLLDMCRSEPV